MNQTFAQIAFSGSSFILPPSSFQNSRPRTHFVGRGSLGSWGLRSRVHEIAFGAQAKGSGTLKRRVPLRNRLGSAVGLFGKTLWTLARGRIAVGPKTLLSGSRSAVAPNERSTLPIGHFDRPFAYQRLFIVRFRVWPGHPRRACSPRKCLPAKVGGRRRCRLPCRREMSRTGPHPDCAPAAAIGGL
jgi:hypothetical protein